MECKPGKGAQIDYGKLYLFIVKAGNLSDRCTPDSFDFSFNPFIGRR